RGSHDRIETDAEHRFERSVSYDEDRITAPERGIGLKRKIDVDACDVVRMHAYRDGRLARKRLDQPRDDRTRFDRRQPQLARENVGREIGEQRLRLQLERFAQARAKYR